jgi:hypothetical protein
MVLVLLSTFLWTAAQARESGARLGEAVSAPWPDHGPGDREQALTDGRSGVFDLYNLPRLLPQEILRPAAKPYPVVLGEAAPPICRTGPPLRREALPDPPIDPCRAAGSPGPRTPTGPPAS